MKFNVPFTLSDDKHHIALNQLLFYFLFCQNDYQNLYHRCYSKTLHVTRTRLKISHINNQHLYLITGGKMSI